MSVWAYLFEANSLQAYIFATGKLRDVSGASELIADLAFEALPDDLAAHSTSADSALEFPKSLKDALHREIEALSYQRNFPIFDDVYLRHAGGALGLALDAPGAEAFLMEFRDRWRLFVAREAPGLDFSDGLAAGDTEDGAQARARELLRACPPMRLSAGPPGSPLIRPASRTGLPAVAVAGKTTGAHTCRIVKGDHVDAPTIAARNFLPDRNYRHILPDLFAGFETGDYLWPVIMEPGEDGDADDADVDTGGGYVEAAQRAALFEAVDPDRLTARRRVIGVTHVDGNRIGALFLEAERLGVAKRLSHLMNAAMIRATREAVRRVLLPACYEDKASGRRVIPARPVVLGGDDLTALIRGDLALSFIREFTEAYENATKGALTSLGAPGAQLSAHLDSATGVPHPTVKAGVAFIGARQPFFRGYRLCEELAGIAGEAGKERSRVAFWRVTGAHIPETRSELEDQTRAGGRSIWRGAWPILGHEPGGLEFLLELRDRVFELDAGRGALREVAAHWLDMHGQALERQARAIAEANKRSIGAGCALEEAIAAAQGGDPRYTPLLDAHTLAQLEAI